MNSVILKIQTPYVVWYEHKLIPYNMKKDNYNEAHFIPIKRDLSDLVYNIEWCRSNDKKCKKIAKNAMDFYNEFLTKDSVLDYWQSVLCKITN